VPSESGSVLGAVESVIDALRDESPWIRHAAARALFYLRDLRAVGPLIGALADESEQVRYWAAVALGELGDRRALEPLSARLRDGKEAVRSAAASALGRLGAPSAVVPLVAALSDPDWTVRCSAAEALGAFRERLAIEPLVLALGDPRQFVRLAAAEALGKSGDAGAVAPLIAVLADRNMWVRGTAALALGRLGDARALGALRAALGDPDEVVRQRAAAAINTLGAPPEEQKGRGPGAPDSRAAVGSFPEYSMLDVAGQMLGKPGTGDLRGRPVLIGPEDMEKRPSRWREPAVIVGVLAGGLVAVIILLMAWHEPRSRPTEEQDVLKSFSDGKVNVAEAIQRLGGAEMAAWRLVAALEMLERSRAQGKPEPLAPAEVRSACVLIAACGKPAIPFLKASFSYSPMRLHVVNVLVIMGEDAQAAEDELILAAAEPDQFVRATAIRSLCNFRGDPQKAVPVLAKALLEETGSDRRRAAAVALGDYGPAAEPAIPALEAALRDDVEPVRSAAAEALEKIRGEGPGK
jgi:HEAT repeat protein